MRHRFRCQLESLLGISLNVIGDQALRLPHVLTFELPSRVHSRNILQQRLPEICFGPSAAVPDSSEASRWSPYVSMGMKRTTSVADVAHFDWLDDFRRGTSAEHSS